MQVQPIAAIRPLKIRQNPTVNPQNEQEKDSQSGNPFVAGEFGAHQYFARTTGTGSYYGDRSDYYTQVLADGHSSAQTAMERTTRISEYKAPKNDAAAVSVIAVSV
ncbi:hypothetical protein E1180_18385 [Roseibium denhamense]|uniref:Uncharacterized protein n=1 Tax=Roseibium denhamense TaxID=76305 RepID=A0ABY1PAD7_9HYPH|nr:hypothetical protein [Roseibium denhamense]MTI07472.1 hypothetical protein [Roseibium denhamense]SMP29956.1 hypothetical protein SAMN06265374_3167 [Roseibium denhamense]